MALAQHAAPDPEGALAAAEEDVASKRAAIRAGSSRAARAALIDALITFAERALSHGREADATAALSEADSHFPKKLPGSLEWRQRFFAHNRTKAALAQRQNRQADAVQAFEAALSVLSADPEAAEREENAVRLQILVRLARSRLALGQAAEVESEMQECDALLRVLAGRIPPRPIEIVRAAILGNAGIAQAMLGKTKDAETNFAASIATIDRVAAPELAQIREHILTTWEGTLRSGGRLAEADAVRAGHGDARHDHDEECGCGDPHHHHHHHRARPRPSRPRR